MLECPKCEANLTWQGGTDVSPNAVSSIYMCANSDCGMTHIKAVVEE
jgi:hypothetical protein